MKQTPLKKYFLFFTLLTFSILIHILFPEFSKIIFKSIIDAYIGVAVFVALTFLIIYKVEKLSKRKFHEIMLKHKKYQVLIASLLGIIPGCGGAIIVVVNYTKGYVTFGSLVAVLISTMGDAAFILLAAKPLSALAIFAISLVTAVITGTIVDKFNINSKIKYNNDSDLNQQPNKDYADTSFWNSFDKLFVLSLIPGLLYGFLSIFNIDANLFTNNIYPNLFDDLALAGGFLLISIFLMKPSENNPMQVYSNKIKLRRKITGETAFINFWVFLGFVSYELASYYFNLNISELFSTIGIFIPLIAVLIGFIPGCGPQIIVTAMYINGAIPFSAQIANSISNDGDALFPCLSIEPKSAVKATLISAIPAIILSYIAYTIEMLYY